MNDQQFIPCPTENCSGNIFFDPHELMRGAQFVCPICNTVVGLAPESREIVNEAIEKFDELKRDIIKMKKDHSMS
ncbi:hypothetical protein [Sinomicrobium weinanense]|uniref:Uncharacterized protein n=1 Tax=Sinomicrobium weinanense TaxID=2842200 RepID=A0A926JSM7_9FLAO|nr:hypothetical protein [Sinomicrobium weinanense]MBC9796775.1 hypothetical protein [Sinomicrobium weinanense]MBU3125538.1 hypothetical protein [Sinomicrobium weinanense]